MPTQFTYRAGYALITSSVLWLVAMGFIYWSDTIAGPWEGLPQQLFLTGALTLVAAGVTLVAGIVGINRRHGGAFGTAGRVTFWLAVVTAVTAFGSWFWAPWLTTLGIGAVILAVALNDSDIAPRAAGRLVGLGGAIAAGSAWAFHTRYPRGAIGQQRSQRLHFRWPGLLRRRPFIARLLAEKRRTRRPTRHNGHRLILRRACGLLEPGPAMRRSRR